MKRWLDGKEWAIIFILLVLICSLAVGMIVYVVTLRSIRNDETTNEEPNKQVEVIEENTNEVEEEPVETEEIDDRFEIIYEENNNETPMSNCTYCEKEINGDDDNNICEECEYEDWSWHCSICDSVLTKEEYEGSGVCGICEQNKQTKLNNSKYGICDLCGESILQEASGRFEENDNMFCSGICKDKFFNRTSLYGYCELCTRALYYSESVVCNGRCEQCANKNR